MNITIRKGSRYVALDRVKAKNMVNDQLAIALQSWLEYTFIPDEHYYSTLATVKSYKLKVNSDKLYLYEFTDRCEIFYLSERYCEAGPFL